MGTIGRSHDSTTEGTECHREDIALFCVPQRPASRPADQLPCCSSERRDRTNGRWGRLDEVMTQPQRAQSVTEKTLHSSVSLSGLCGCPCIPLCPSVASVVAGFSSKFFLHLA